MGGGAAKGYVGWRPTRSVVSLAAKQIRMMVLLVIAGVGWLLIAGIDVDWENQQWTGWLLAIFLLFGILSVVPWRAWAAKGDE